MRFAGELVGFWRRCLALTGKGRCGGAGRRCLPRRGRSASFGRAPGFGDLGALTAGGMLPRASFLRARAGLAARRESSALPRDSPFRRGYDGLCPSRSRDLSLENPFCAAQTPQPRAPLRKPGGPYTWAVRRASLSLPSETQPRTPAPFLSGRGFGRSLAAALAADTIGGLCPYPLKGLVP